MSARRWLGRMHPASGNQGAYQAAKRRATFAIEKKKKQEKRKRRWGGTSRRLAKKAAREARKRQNEALVTVATYNVRSLAVKGKNELGHGEDVLGKGRQLGCDLIGLHQLGVPAARRSVRQGIAFIVQVRKQQLRGKGYTE